MGRNTFYLTNNEKSRYGEMANKYTEEVLKEAVKNSTSYAGVLRYLNIRPSGGMQSYLTKRIKTFDIDTSHFKGQFQGLRSGTNKLHFMEVLVVQDETDHRQPSSRLRRALLEAGRLYVCQCCGIGPYWNNEQLVLEIDHVNMKNWDNREQNLQFLCPNCHSQKTKREYNHE